MRVIRTVATVVLQRDNRAGVPGSVTLEFRTRVRAAEVGVGRASAGEVPRHVTVWVEPQRVADLVSDDAAKSSLPFHRRDVGLVQLDLTENRQCVPSAGSTQSGERERSIWSIYGTDGNEDERIVVNLVELGLTGKAGIRGVIEAKVSKVF